MLPSKLRISKAEFKALGRGMNYHSPTIMLSVYKKIPTLQTLNFKDFTNSPSQFSFICSKKVAKSAVKRNLLRRRGYNVVQKLLNIVKPGFYFVFNFKKGAAILTYGGIKDEIHSLLQKSGAISSV